MSQVKTKFITNNAVTNPKIRQSSGLSVIGNSTNSTANVADITGTANQVLVVNSAGTSLGFGAVNLASSAAVTGALAIANGGTGQTSASSAFGALSPLTTKGDILGYDTANNRVPVGTNGQVLTADSTQTLGLKWATPTTGTVTSVALTVPAFLSVSGSPVTGSGTLAVTLATETANTVFAGPTTGAAATPTFRALVGADLPNPSATTLGGIESYAAVTHQWINTISTSGVPSSTQPAFTDISGSVAAAQMPALTGDVTTTAGTVATTIANNVVTNAKLAQMPTNTIKGNNTGGTANATDLTVAQTLTMLGIMSGKTTISSASTSQAVTFSTAFGTTGYSITANMLNTTDTNPQFQPITITAQATTGFTAKWNAPTATANYVLSWQAILSN